MSDETKIPEPTAADMEMQLERLYELNDSNLAQAILEDMSIALCCIRRAYHAERKLAALRARIEGAPKAWFVEYDTGGSMMGHAYKPDTTWDPSYEAPGLVHIVPVEKETT